MKTILVTGGAGFIGSNFVNRLLATTDNRVVVLDSLTYASNADAGPKHPAAGDRFQFWQGDVRNGELVDRLVGESDVVVHMAAESHVTRSIYDDKLFFETDVLGTQAVAQAVVRHRDRIERLIHVSTSEVYGDAHSEMMDEDHPLNPMSPYASAKCGADRLIFSYWSTYNIPAVIVRPFNNYGPRQHLEKAVPRFISSCLLGEDITIHGDGSAARDWMFVEDHCDALQAVMAIDIAEVVGQVVNLGSGESRSVLEVANAVRSIIPGGQAIGLQHLGDRPGQVSRHTCDWSKAKKLIAWQPKTTFEEGITRTIRWYMDHRDWWEPMVWMRHIPIITADGRSEMH